MKKATRRRPLKENGGMDKAIAQLLAPFLLVLMLVIARPVGKIIERLLPDGRIKRYLTKKRSNRSEFFERADARMFAFLRRLIGRPR
jgi:hypothetical protein